MTNGILNSIKYRDQMILKLKALSAGTDLHDRLSANLKSYNKTLKYLSGKQKYNTMPTNWIRTSRIYGILGLL